jgi:hypothetical protein
MLYNETAAPYSENNIKHMNSLCKQAVELLNFKPVGT